MNELVTSLTTITIAIIGLAIISVLVSRNAQTGSVIGASAGGFAGDLLAAEAPVTGQAPGSGYFGTNGQPPMGSYDMGFSG